MSSQERMLLLRLLGMVPPCGCQRRHAWLSRRPIEHSAECRAAEALKVEIELALSACADDPTDSVRRQIDDTITAGYRWLAATRGS